MRKLRALAGLALIATAAEVGCLYLAGQEDGPWVAGMVAAGAFQLLGLAACGLAFRHAWRTDLRGSGAATWLVGAFVPVAVFLLLAALFVLVLVLASGLSEGAD